MPLGRVIDNSNITYAQEDSCSLTDILEPLHLLRPRSSPSWQGATPCYPLLGKKAHLDSSLLCTPQPANTVELCSNLTFLTTSIEFTLLPSVHHFPGLLNSLLTHFSYIHSCPLHFILHSSARVSLLKHETDNIFFFFNFIFNTQSIFFFY